MVKRVTFSNQHLSLNEISVFYSDTDNALRLYFLLEQNSQRFHGYIKDEITAELEKRLEENGYSTSLTILAVLEAAFRIDYLNHVNYKKKDPLSKSFRVLYQDKGPKVSFKSDILNHWAFYNQELQKLISDLRSAIQFRDWLAHGRYWTPKFGRRYDYEGVYTLAKIIFNKFPLILI